MQDHENTPFIEVNRNDKGQRMDGSTERQDELRNVGNDIFRDMTKVGEYETDPDTRATVLPRSRIEGLPQSGNVPDVEYRRFGANDEIEETGVISPKYAMSPDILVGRESPPAVGSPSLGTSAPVPPLASVSKPTVTATFTGSFGKVQVPFTSVTEQNGMLICVSEGDQGFSYEPPPGEDSFEVVISTGTVRYDVVYAGVTYEIPGSGHHLVLHIEGSRNKEATDAEA